MSSQKYSPLSQSERPKCSLPLKDADLNLGNANWSKGLQAMSDWIWSGNLNPQAFPNHLARFFLQIPGIFEQQLNFSTTLIFDEPSFKNGVQISGFVDRVSRELAISLIAQRRKCWYSMTHHAILGRLTATKYGLTENQFIEKWQNLTEYNKHPEFYSRVERAVLTFADTFSSNPKAYTDEQYDELRSAFREDNEKRYSKENLWQSRLEAAREARALALLENLETPEMDKRSRMASEAVPRNMPPNLNEIKIDAQVVELTFLCLQFVALTDVFTGLNIPDEDFLAETMVEVLPPSIIEHINRLNEQGLKASETPLVLGPPSDEAELLKVDDELFNAILKGDVVVEPAPLKGSRIPLIPYEGRDNEGNLRPAFQAAPDRDKGLTVGGLQIAVYGWVFGGHFPGGLVYALRPHPELARYEPPYSLPLLFNEDEWRNGVQTSGYVSRRLKELVIQKIYRMIRTRYGIEHHTMYLYNTFLDEHGLGRSPSPDLLEEQRQLARESALARAENATLYMHNHEYAPDGIYNSMEKEVLCWTESLVCTPHQAYNCEKRVRAELDKENRREIKAGIRRLDASSGLSEEAALNRLVDHQIAELAMVIGHMDGLGRALTILGVEAEDPVQMIEGSLGPRGGIIPDLDEDGQVKVTGYFNNRPGLHQILRLLGISDKVLTLNELIVNPKLCKKIKERLRNGEKKSRISANQAAETGEF
jgi:alkylhydroperoxidase family enzyme